MLRPLAIALLAFSPSLLAAAEYARPELLVEPAELVDDAFGRETTFSSAGAALIDLRPAAGLGDEGFHRAKHVDVSEWKGAFGVGDDAAGWSARIGAVVPHPDATVVVLDDGVTPSAARVWWVLKYWGAKDVRIANANDEQLRKAARAASLSSRPIPTPEAPFVATPHPHRLATHDEVLALSAGGASTCLLDTRSDAEVAQGVIPTSEHADWVRFVDRETGRMRSADELAALLQGAGFDAGRPAVAYCRSGGRASVVAFAMELMGGREVANYFGSWNDWSSRPGSPIVKQGAVAP